MPSAQQLTAADLEKIRKRAGARKRAKLKAKIKAKRPAPPATKEVTARFYRFGGPDGIHALEEWPKTKGEPVFLLVGEVPPKDTIERHEMIDLAVDVGREAIAIRASEE
jgi:hypothetical protein